MRGGGGGRQEKDGGGLRMEGWERMGEKVGERAGDLVLHTRSYG